MNTFSWVTVQTPPQPYSANHLVLPATTQAQQQEEWTLAHNDWIGAFPKLLTLETSHPQWWQVMLSRAYFLGFSYYQGTEVQELVTANLRGPRVVDGATCLHPQMNHGDHSPAPRPKSLSFLIESAPVTSHWESWGEEKLSTEMTGYCICQEPQGLALWGGNSRRCTNICWINYLRRIIWGESMTIKQRMLYLHQEAPSLCSLLLLQAYPHSHLHPCLRNAQVENVHIPGSRLLV